jgi:hypothetical protein
MHFASFLSARQTQPRLGELLELLSKDWIANSLSPPQA